MKWAAADIAAMLSTMGDSVTITDGSIAGASITGIYEAPFEQINQFTGSVEMSLPSMLVATSDIEDFTEHSTCLRVNNTDYLVTGIQPGGDGWTRIYLREN